MSASALRNETYPENLLPFSQGSKRQLRDRQVVNRLFDALLDNDRDRIVSFFSDDTVFQPVSSAPVVGDLAIWGALQQEFDGGVERVLCHMETAADGSIRAEVTERRRRSDGWQERQLSSTFAVRGCKIARWLDSPDAG